MDMIYYLYNNRDFTTTTSYTLEQARDTIDLIDKLFELYGVVDDENKIYLQRRIEQQAERAKVRLDRAVKSMLEEKNVQTEDN